jgi:hypothetical protein
MGRNRPPGLEDHPDQSVARQPRSLIDAWGGTMHNEVENLKEEIFALLPLRTSPGGVAPVLLRPGQSLRGMRRISE